MIQLVENLLSYSLLEDHEKTLRQTDLNFVFSEVKYRLAENIHQTGATIHSHNLPVVNGVRPQLVQLFTNILDNSIKFRNSQIAPQISIESEVTSHISIDGQERTGIPYFHLTFRDNGIGFEKEYAGTIFEILQKLHGHNEYEGSGIGLA
ncbi:MAG: sensor histidine kinase, partial [Flavisolibacter sp.]